MAKKSAVKKGTVKWFDKRRGFGFIESEDGDVFVHYSDIIQEGYKSLSDGQAVEYELGTNDKGTKAINVKVVA